MNKKHSSLFGTVLIVTAILVVINWLVGALGFMNLRFDLTQKKIYTLSDGTRRILSNIKPDEPVTIRFYATRDSRLMPQYVQSYETTVEDLLLEFEKASDGKISLERVDPRPDTDSEDKARADDIAGHPVNENEDKVYFGLAVQSRDHKEVIPSLSPNEESSLEYDIARSIAKVIKVKKAVVGVLSPMPIAGPAMNFPMMREQQPQPWAVIEQLRLDYDVREVAATADKIDKDIGILIVIHPADVQERTEFAIDQFVLGGGKVIAFVDPQCAVSAMFNSQQNNPMMGMTPPTIPPSSNLKELFKAWGIGYDAGLVVADMNDRTRFQNRALPTYLTIGADGINKTEPVTAPLEMVQMFSAGAFTVEKKDGIKSVTLLQSSENSMMVDTTTAEKARREPLNSFSPDGHRHILGLQLSGNFKTAFPDGQPKAKPAAERGPQLPGGMPPGFPGGGGTGGSDKDAGAPVAAPAAAEAPKSAVTPAPATAPAPAQTAPAAAPAPPQETVPPFLKESTNNEGIVFLFADADMLYDGFCFQQDPMGRLALLNQNVPLLLNAVELLNGGADLIAVRSRGSTKRDFIKLQELSDDVEKAYRPRIQELTNTLNDTAQKLSSLKVTTDKKGNQTVIVDQKQKKDIDDLMATQTRINKELRDIRKEQNKGRDRLEMWITLLNLLAVPLLVIVFGVTLAMKRRSTQAAR